MKRLATLVVFLAACSSNEPPASVQQTFFAQFGAVQQLQATRVAPFSIVKSVSAHMVLQMMLMCGLGSGIS